MIPIEREFWAAEQALCRLQRKLAALPGWRESLAWEAVERALGELYDGMWDASCLPHMPSDFKHWREKYTTDDPL